MQSNKANKDYNLTDRLLVEKILGGDNRAFAIIIQQTEALVTQIIFKMINNPHDRQDLVQDIYLKAYQNLSRFIFQSKLSTWIGQIAYNTCINYLRKKSPQLFDHTGDGNDHGNVVIDPGQGAAQLMMQSEMRIVLLNAIDQLPPVYKTFVSLYHQEELSYEEIVEITELPEGTVKSYLYWLG